MGPEKFDIPQQRTDSHHLLVCCKGGSYLSSTLTLLPSALATATAAIADHGGRKRQFGEWFGYACANAAPTCRIFACAAHHTLRHLERRKKHQTSPRYHKQREDTILSELAIIRKHTMPQPVQATEAPATSAAPAPLAAPAAAEPVPAPAPDASQSTAPVTPPATVPAPAKQ